MIVIDSSALVAILAREPECQDYLQLLDAVERRLLSAITYFETGIVMTMRLGPQGLDDLDDLIEELSAEIVPFDYPQASAALATYTRYGKGTGSRANLNLGDCASYALAKGMNVPLLFKGKDFSATDVIPAATA